MSAEDRVSTAAEATAAAVRHIRPLTLPEPTPASAERREHRGGNPSRGGDGRLRNMGTWLIPLGAAAVVAALALTLVILRHAEAPRPVPTNGSAVTGIPRYYAVATEGKVSPGKKAAIAVHVTDVYTGKALVTVALPATDVTAGVGEVAGVSAAGDDRTFVVGRRNGDSAITYFLVHIAPGAGHVATVGQLPVPAGNPGALLGFALSPDGRELAVMSVRGNGTTLRVYSVKSGATLRTWTAGTWRTVDSEYLEGVDVSWTADSRHVAFATVLPGGQDSPAGALEERLITATAPSGDLVTASKVVFKAPGNCLSLLLTPDGGTVVCGTQVNPPGTPSSGDCGKSGPMIVAYSAATGKRLRVLYQHTGACRSGSNTVLWSDDSARHVIGEALTMFQGSPPPYTYRFGVAAAGKFTNFAVAQQGQSSSGPAF